MILKETNFDKTTNGDQIRQITIGNGKDIEFSVINWGATIISLKLADRDGNIEECHLGFDNMKDYETHGGYYGATIGRIGNRVANGVFKLDGREYKLATNDSGVNCLHGGLKGFDKVIWDYTTFNNDDEAGVSFKYLSKDGEENFPGNLDVEVKFTLNIKNEFIIEYKATTDKSTPVNLTNHAYWNLSGFKENIHDHKLCIEADTYLPTNEFQIPTGELKSVVNSAFDFTSIKSIGENIKVSGGFDHNFNLSVNKSKTPNNRAYIEHTKSGRSMEILTTEPGIQLYTGFDKHDFFCLETQMFPDAINQEAFDSIVLKPGEIYSQTTIHKFEIK